MIRLLVTIAVLLTALPARAETVTVGSKTFTESIILGYIIADVAKDGGFDAVYRPDIGGTRVVFNALKSGDIDLYVDYTGTITRELLPDQNLASPQEIRAALEALGLGMGPQLGFNNTYALAVPKTAVPAVQTISDLTQYPELVFGFASEFMDRADGWPALRQTYSLPQTNVSGMEHELAYRALSAGSADVIVAYSTDANIEKFDLRLLADDKNLFPRYDAVILYRLDLAERAPGLVEHLNMLEEAISDDTMRSLNSAVAIDGQTEQQAASEFLREALKIDAATITPERGFWDRLLKNTLDHLALVGISLSAAVLLAIPLGIWAFRDPSLGQGILAVTGILQTIPSLALFVFMIPLVGIGGPPAIIALFLYSLLPIVRNTHAGLTDIPPAMLESAQALGLPSGVILRRIEIPLAARSILAGIKTAAVINIGTATLGALIGAGGYGQPILTGIRLADTGLILEGAVPAALMALAAQGLFELLERAVVPKGLRLPRAGAGA